MESKKSPEPASFISAVSLRSLENLLSKTWYLNTMLINSPGVWIKNLRAKGSAGISVMCVVLQTVLKVILHSVC